MGWIVINPGTGPVEGSTEDQATKNIEAFAKDLLDTQGVEVKEAVRTSKLDYGEGRFAFEVKISRKDACRTLEIQMPGCPLGKVRYIEGATPDLLDSMRLYVDGSSWEWGFALNVSVPEKE